MSENPEFHVFMWKRVCLRLVPSLGYIKRKENLSLKYCFYYNLGWNFISDF